MLFTSDFISQIKGWGRYFYLDVCCQCIKPLTMRGFSVFALVILFFLSSLFGRVDFENMKTFLHLIEHSAVNHSHSHSHEEDSDNDFDDDHSHSPPAQIQIQVQVEHSHHSKKNSEHPDNGAHSHQINLTPGALFFVVSEIKSTEPRQVPSTPLPLEPQILQQQGFLSSLFRPPIA